MPITPTVNEEQRVRRLAEKVGLKLRKSRTRDGAGKFEIIDGRTGAQLSPSLPLSEIARNLED